MRPEILLIAFLGFATALPLESKENNNAALLKEALFSAQEGARIGIVETAILNVLEQLRQLMISGSDNFPILDPIHIENIHVGEEIINVPNTYITIDDMTISDLSTFEMEHIEFSVVSVLLQRYRLDFDLSIPAVNVKSSSYDMWLKIFGGDIYGKGDMGLQIVRPRVKGHIVVGLRLSLDGIFLSIYESRISVGLDEFKVEINGLFGNEASSEFASRFLSNLIPEMLEFFEEDITNTISTLVLIIGNLILADIDIGALLPINGSA